jgi:hypothetical protein
MFSFQRAPSHASAPAVLLLMRSANKNLREMSHIFNARSGNIQLVIQRLHGRSHITSQLLQHTIRLQPALLDCHR